MHATIPTRDSGVLVLDISSTYYRILLITHPNLCYPVRSCQIKSEASLGQEGDVICFDFMKHSLGYEKKSSHGREPKHDNAQSSSETQKLRLDVFRNSKTRTKDMMFFNPRANGC